MALMASHRHGRPASGFDVGDHLVCTAFARCVIDDDLRAVGRELASDARADPFRSARYDAAIREA